MAPEKLHPEAPPESTIVLDVFRYSPETGEAPRFQTYRVPFRREWVVLDALNHIKDHIDPTLSFRWSCRMGSCGSCAMMVNGKPQLACSTFLRDYYPRNVRVQPLAHFPVIRDLVVDLDDFLDKLTEVKAWLIPREPRSISDGTYRQTPAERARYRQYSMCINCGICYAACPVYGGDREFIGPAALALAHRYNLDSRDDGRAERSETVYGEHGIWGCVVVGDCTRFCPKDVDPSAAIQQEKLACLLHGYWSLFRHKSKS
jgi:fumarate reductase iron-sulfur subunit